MNSISLSDGLPKTLIIFCNSSKLLSAGNKGCLPNNSANIHPILHISTGLS